MKKLSEEKILFIALLYKNKGACTGITREEYEDTFGDITTCDKQCPLKLKSLFKECSPDKAYKKAIKIMQQYPEIFIEYVL